MSKRFKNKTCVYCAKAKSSNTGDHVLAREFVATQYRGQIPVVPSCEGCNSKKSKLEHYLTAILPFGGRHASALENLSDNTPSRLRKNQRLLRGLNAGISRIWSREPSGIFVRTSALPLDGESLDALIGMIARGLMFHHWRIILDAEINVQVLNLTKDGDAFFNQYLRLNSKQRVANNIGDGALLYE